MSLNLRPSRLGTCVIVCLAIFCPSILAQPRPAETGPSIPTKPLPSVSRPTMTVSGPSTVPMGASMFQGIITDEEYKTFSAFQQQVNSDPALKAINEKIAKLSHELQQLHAEATATREKLIAANPAVKAIQNKIAAAMHSRMGPSPAGPTSMPVPMPAKGSPTSMPGPIPAKAK